MVTVENLSKAKVELSKLRIASQNNTDLSDTIRSLEKEIRKVENRVMKKKYKS